MKVRIRSGWGNESTYSIGLG